MAGIIGFTAIIQARQIAFARANGVDVQLIQTFRLGTERDLGGPVAAG
jgi:hypothetical protein